MLWRWWFSLSSVGSHMGNSNQSLWNFQLLQNFCQGQNSDSNSTFWSCHYLRFSADRLILMSVYNLAEVWDQCWWLQIVAETFLQHWVCLLISFSRQVPLWTLHHFGVDYLLSTLLVLGQDTFYKWDDLLSDKNMWRCTTWIVDSSVSKNYQSMWLRSS